MNMLSREKEIPSTFNNERRFKQDQKSLRKVLHRKNFLGNRGRREDGSGRECARRCRTGVIALQRKKRGIFTRRHQGAESFST